MKASKLISVLMTVVMCSSLISCSNGGQTIEKTSESTTETTLPPLPESWSALDNGCVTEVRNQIHGDCWAYASATCIDINNQMINGERLLFTSDEIVENCFSDRWTEGRVMPDYLDPYNIGGYSLDVVKLFTYGYNGYFLHDANYYQGCTEDEIKRELMEYGCLQIGVADNVSYDLNGGRCLYANDRVDPDHAVVIIGWDDTYSRENFHADPGRDGAWLAQNSHGENWGDGGFYWISYETPLYEVNSFVMCEDYSETLGYAYYNFNTISTGDTTTYANAFDHEGTLAAVGVCTTIRDTGVRIEIYNEDMSEMIYTQDAVLGAMGYHVIDLDEPLEVTSFVVVVTMPGEICVEGEENTDPVDPYVAGCEPGQSFVLIDDEWVDMCSPEIQERLGIDFEPNNFLITAVYA